jgi:hypothetical protein
MKERKGCWSLSVALPLTHTTPWTRARSDASNAIMMMMFRYWRKLHALLEWGGLHPTRANQVVLPILFNHWIFFCFKFNLLSFNCFRSIKLNLFYKIKHKMCVIVFPRHHKISISRQQNKNCHSNKKNSMWKDQFFLKKNWGNKKESWISPWKCNSIPYVCKKSGLIVV